MLTTCDHQSLWRSLRDALGRPFGDALSGSFRHALWDRRSGYEPRNEGNEEQICLRTHLVEMVIIYFVFLVLRVEFVTSEGSLVSFTCWEALASVKAGIHGIYPRG
jgi:hypothetical protein